MQATEPARRAFTAIAKQNCAVVGESGCKKVGLAGVVGVS